MDNPTFKLEGIVKTRDEMEDFEGPLILILQLLAKNKIEIKDIQISLLLEQYLEYLEEIKSMDLEIASEFVSMASHLVYIKTRMLLNAEEEISELDELISSLESIKCRDTYLQIKSVTPRFLDMYRRGGGQFVKLPEPLEINNEYRYSHTKEDILDAMRRVLDKEESIAAAAAIKPMFAMPKQIIYSITEKAGEIISRLKQMGVMRFGAFFNESRSRTELVATFVAVLELCRAGRVYLSDTDDDITISCTGTDSESEIESAEFDIF